MDEKEFRSWGVVLVLVAFLFVLAALSAHTAWGQETLRPSGRIAPGPDSTPTPTPTPDPVERQCAYMPSPWGVPCDVRNVCTPTFMPMYIGVPNPIRMKLVTDLTRVEVWKIVPFGTGPLELSIDWPTPVRWAEWHMEGHEKVLYGCYCDERRNMVVLCAVGQYAGEVPP